MEINTLLNNQPILLYDGDCGFCNKAILFFLKREKNNTMHFASLQSEAGLLLKNHFELDSKIDSMILIKDYSAHIKSCAALRLTLYMKGLWPLIIVFVVIPPFIRNYFYDYVAKKRKSITKSIAVCQMVNDTTKSRFLDL
jgi:predicted DCC family thiol-disulfide oxidoreductase YuxK